MRKRVIGIMVAVCMFISSGCITKAAVEDNQIAMPASIDVNTVTSLSISSSGTATSTCTVSGASGELTKISITMTLQKKAGSGKFYAVNTWTGTKSSNYYKMQKTASVAKGTYRVMAKVTCYMGSTSETTYKYSSTKTY